MFLSEEIQYYPNPTINDVNVHVSGKDKRVIHAMIQNFQQRIDLLSEVLEQIENIKSLNNQNYESNTI